MTFSDKIRVLIFADQNRVRSMFLEFLLIVEGGGSLINVFLRVYFDVFRQSLRFNFRRLKQSSFYVFGVFVNCRGGSILTYFDKVRVVIFAHQNRVRSMFLEFLLISGAVHCCCCGWGCGWYRFRLRFSTSFGGLV